MKTCIILLALMGIAAALHIEGSHVHNQRPDIPILNEDDSLNLENGGQPGHAVLSGAQNKQGPGVPGGPCAICG